MELREYADRELMAMAVADRLSSDLGRALSRQDRATLAVPGGSSPGPIFDVMSGVAIDWDRVTVVPTDERWVPADHDRSNARLIRARLLRDAASAATFLPLYAAAEAPEDALDDLTAALRPALPLSVLLLGMGEDMHTASLFPGGDNLGAALAKGAPPLMAMRADGAGEPRVTLTAPVLRDAMSAHILITGPEKRAALERAQGREPSEAPIAAVLADATVHWAE